VTLSQDANVAKPLILGDFSSMLSKAPRPKLLIIKDFGLMAPLVLNRLT
jgi:hypothetical protein